jgi:membrane protease YdiL (CAAX protease family)
MDWFSSCRIPCGSCDGVNPPQADKYAPMNIFETIEQLSDYITVTDVIVLAAGISLLSIWLLRTSLGRTALLDSVPRRNNMRVYVPFVPIVIWLTVISVTTAIKDRVLDGLPDWQNAFMDNVILCIAAVLAITSTLFLAKAHFVRRLRGFGLNPKTIHKDLIAAVINLLSVWPLVMLMIVLTVFFGKLIWGKDFDVQQHEELKLIAQYPQLPVRVLIIITAVVIVPAFEETFFRGLFQSWLRSIITKPWLAILICSGVFVVMHADASHWPALLALSMSMGYAYEKSGSLFRPIFIHSLFNAASIIAALNQ